MSLEHEDIRKIARLARLAVNEADVSRYAHDLSGILTFVEQMNNVDTQGVLPMAHPMDAGQRLRPDEITEVNQRELFQTIAPQVAEGFYLVPKVIE